MEKESQTIFDKNVIEFVTVAAEFCAFLERAERMKRSDFVDTSLKDTSPALSQGIHASQMRNDRR